MLKLFQTKILESEEIVHLKQKELDKIALGKRLFCFNKKAPWLTKVHLDKPERQVGVESPPLIRSCF